MDTFNPRYQLEAEETVSKRQRASLHHAEILQTLDALEHLARRLRKKSLPYRRRG